MKRDRAMASGVTINHRGAIWISPLMSRKPGGVQGSLRPEPSPFVLMATGLGLVFRKLRKKAGPN
jgi:hypothetical protein